MNYKKPFYVNGVKVSIGNGGKSVVVYHKYPEISDDQKLMIDNVIQYLMDEYFILKKTCRVDIYCADN